jgi:hypothetical protein
VLDILHGQMFCLNPVGSRILELLEQGWDEAHIADEIGRGCGLGLETVRGDVDEFVEALKEHHILASPASGELYG